MGPSSLPLECEVHSTNADEPLAQIKQLYQQQGDTETALRYFNEYLDEDSTGTHAEDATARVQALPAESMEDRREPSRQ